MGAIDYTALAEEARGDGPPAEQAGTNEALTAAIMEHLAPYIHKGLEELATNPNVMKTGAKIGRVIGGLSAPIGGALEAGPAGFLMGSAAASKSAWAGGKTGWFTGKMLQNIAASLEPHVKSIAEAVSPYLHEGIGAQSALDLAQMADPDRKDIGVLGVGKTVDASAPPNQEQRKRQQAAELDYLKAAIKDGQTPQAAAKQLAKGDMTRYAALMSLYMKAPK